MVKNVSEKTTVEEAIASGLEPCKICNPHVQTNNKQGPDIQKGKNDTVQCKGFTKAGTRCLHMTRIANGYCYQHQPKN